MYNDKRQPKRSKLIKLDEFVFPGLGKQIVGENFVESIAQTLDGRFVILQRMNERLSFIPTDIGIPAYYPLIETTLPTKATAVFMDFDGTSVKSEGMWINILETTLKKLLGNEAFGFSDNDLAYITGYNESEHLFYCIKRYVENPPSNSTVNQAKAIYSDIVDKTLNKLLSQNCCEEIGVFPAPYLKEFLHSIKHAGLKIALISGARWEKVYPILNAAFAKIDLGNPTKFYDVIITGGYRTKYGQAGTLGAFATKPHPWLYFEALKATGVSRETTIGIEDSASGVIALRTAGIPTIGIAEERLMKSGADALCQDIAIDLKEIKNRYFH